MSVPSSPVNLQVRFTREAMALLASLTEQAIVNAVERTKMRLKAFALSFVSPVPVDTGQLKQSFDIGSTPRSIVMRWSATSPTGYDYALVADIGRPEDAYIGRHYSDQMRDVSREFLVEELTRELQAIQGALP